MTETDHLDALAPGYRMHWYTIDRVLGQGGFGITYLARDNNLDQRVAIKEYLPSDVAARRPDATVRSRGEGSGERFRWGLDRFIQEARTLARFDHPNIVRVMSVFELNGTAYMVMRFEEGENLATLLERRGNMAENEVLRILLPILDGLELVHNAGFIHRDIKPDNIHIRTDGSPVLLDFGSARQSLGKARTLTILVAPGYAPFEQYYSNSENQGPWTDIYGLGATCYRAIAGVPPLDAISRSKGVLGSTREVLVPARNMGAGRYSAQFLAAIDHALEFAEKNRPQSIAAWRVELTTKATTHASVAIPNALASSVSTPVSSEPAEPAPRPASGESWMRPLAGAVAGAVVAAAAIFLWMQPRGDERIAAIERRLEEQRAKELQSKKDALAITAADRPRIGEDERVPQEKKPEMPSVPAAVPVPAPKKIEVAAPPIPPRKDTIPVQPAAKTQAVAGARVPDTVPPPPAEPIAERPAETVAMLKPVPPEPVTVPAAAKPTESAPVIPKDDAGLLAHYRKLALQGDGDAALRAGEMYESGRGVAQSNLWAYRWYGAAEQRGVASAKARKDAIAARLQPVEREQADKLISRQHTQSK